VATHRSEEAKACCSMESDFQQYSVPISTPAHIESGGEGFTKCFAVAGVRLKAWFRPRAEANEKGMLK